MALVIALLLLLASPRPRRHRTTSRPRRRRCGAIPSTSTRAPSSPARSTPTRCARRSAPAAPSPMYVAVLPGDAAASPDEALNALHDAVGLRGTYALVAGRSFRAGSDLFRVAGEASAAAQSHDDVEGALEDFIGRVGDLRAGRRAVGLGRRAAAPASFGIVLLVLLARRRRRVPGRAGGDGVVSRSTSWRRSRRTRATTWWRSARTSGRSTSTCRCRTPTRRPRRTTRARSTPTTGRTGCSSPRASREDLRAGRRGAGGGALGDDVREGAPRGPPAAGAPRPVLLRSPPRPLEPRGRVGAARRYAARRCPPARPTRSASSAERIPQAREVLVGGRRVPYWDAGPAYAPFYGGFFGGFGGLPARAAARLDDRRRLGLTADSAMAASTVAAVISAAEETTVVAVTSEAAATSAAEGTSAAAASAGAISRALTAIVVALLVLAAPAGAQSGVDAAANALANGCGLRRPERRARRPGRCRRPRGAHQVGGRRAHVRRRPPGERAGRAAPAGR